MTDKQFVLALLSYQNGPVNLNQLSSCVPKVPRDNLSEMLEQLSKDGLVKINSNVAFIPRTFEIA